MARGRGGAGAQVSRFSTVKRAEGAPRPPRAALKWEIKGGGRARLPAGSSAEQGAPGRSNGDPRPPTAEPRRARGRCGSGALGESAHVALRPSAATRAALARLSSRLPSWGAKKPHVWSRPWVSALARPRQRGRRRSRRQALGPGPWALSPQPGSGVGGCGP